MFIHLILYLLSFDYCFGLNIKDGDPFCSWGISWYHREKTQLDR